LSSNRRQPVIDRLGRISIRDASQYELADGLCELVGDFEIRPNTLAKQSFDFRSRLFDSLIGTSIRQRPASVFDNRDIPSPVLGDLGPGWESQPAMATSRDLDNWSVSIALTLGESSSDINRLISSRFVPERLVIGKNSILFWHQGV
jgi:hypothetical protein